MRKHLELGQLGAIGSIDVMGVFMRQYIVGVHDRNGFTRFFTVVFCHIPVLAPKQGLRVHQVSCALLKWPGKKRSRSVCRSA